MDKMDRTTSYDFVSPFPTVQYLYDPKKDYCPKYLVSFLMVDQGMKKFVEVVFPMLLVATMNHINVRSYVPGEGIEGDYIANAATFTLSVVVYLPTMVGTSSRQDLFSANNAYITLILLALMLSSIPEDYSTSKIPFSVIGNYLFWLSFAFPFTNMCRFYMFFRRQKTHKVSYFLKVTGEKPEFVPYKPPRSLQDVKGKFDVLLDMKDILKMDEKELSDLKLKTGKSRKFDTVEYA